MQGHWTQSAALVARRVRSLGDVVAGLVEHSVMVMAAVTGGHGEDETGSVKQRVRVVPMNVEVGSVTRHGVGGGTGRLNGVRGLAWLYARLLRRRSRLRWCATRWGIGTPNTSTRLGCSGFVSADRG
jgi:hypothetical protein